MVMKVLVVIMVVLAVVLMVLVPVEEEVYAGFPNMWKKRCLEELKRREISAESSSSEQLENDKISQGLVALALK